MCAFLSLAFSVFFFGTERCTTADHPEISSIPPTIQSALLHPRVARKAISKQTSGEKKHILVNNKRSFAKETVHLLSPSYLISSPLVSRLSIGQQIKQKGIDDDRCSPSSSQTPTLTQRPLTPTHRPQIRKKRCPLALLHVTPQQ